ncbi:MAG: hypothetical protein ABFS05_09975 [Bacteroidota bacterium]
MITNIRKTTGKLLLKREYANSFREKQICNILNAGSIGIVYFLPDEETYRKVSGYVKKLQDSGKNVKALGYVENKHLTGQFLPKLSYDFLYPTGISWNYKPNTTAARDFIDTEFDILIDLSTESLLPLLYITALSKAKFKAGLQNDERAGYLDLMISLQKDEGLDELIVQIHHYLSILNKDK